VPKSYEIDWFNTFRWCVGVILAVYVLVGIAAPLYFYLRH